MTIAVMPNGTGLASIGAIEQLAPGLISAGIGRVPPAQTFIDITQGNRVSESLYDGDLPLIRFGATGVAAVDWEAIRDRADRAPAQVVPGLLTEALEQAGLAASAAPSLELPRLIAANRQGRIDLFPSAGCRAEACGAVRVEELTVSQVERRAGTLGPQDLLIAMERPPAAFRTLTVGIAGAGFDGLLTSDSTRTDGLVTSTDLAPTILEHLDVPVPGEMNGQAIKSAGGRDVAGLIDLRERLEITGQRRGPVVGETLAMWLVVAGIIAALFRRRVAPSVVALLGLSLIYLPLVLLLAPLVDPSLLAERLLAGLVPVALAALTWRFVGGWPALAAACLVTVCAYAADVLAGSILVPLSIPGPNPVSGSRFYGIGNEIEATVAALLPLGMGALLASFASTREGGRLAAVAFLAAGFAAAAAFALGRFGADVGAAIVLPAGAAVAAAVALGTRRGLLIAVLVPLGGLVALMAADVVLGGEAHLTRSLLDAGGLDEAGDVLERRIRLAADSFTRGSSIPYLVAAVVVIALGVRERQRVRGWFSERSVWAGFLGALAATIVGTVSNDSGVVLLILGTAFCLASAGYAWSLRRRVIRD